MVVYILRAVGVGRIKVGVTEDIARRAAEIRAMCPVDIEVVEVLENAGFAQEAWLHEMLRDYWCHGEWFEELGGLEQAKRSFAIYRGATNAVAEVLTKCVPAELWDAIKSNLYAAGAKNIGDAFSNIVGESVIDRSAA